MQTPKKQMQMILDGKVPEYPPHFELLFYLEKEFMNIDRNRLNETCTDPDKMSKTDLEVKTRLAEEFDWAAIYGTSLFNHVDNIAQITKLKDKLGQKALIYDFDSIGVFWMPTGSELMDFVVTLFEKPDEMHQLAKQKLKDGKELAKQIHDAGADFIIHNTDFGFNSGPFISPNHFAEFVTPYMTELVAYIHDLGLPVILHSDGNLNAILDQIKSTDIDGYQSVDPQGHMDIKQVREKYPEWILMGNVNCAMLQDCIEDQIRESVRYAMTNGGIGKKFIFSTSNCIFEGMPPQSYEIMLNEYNKLIKQTP